MSRLRTKFSTGYGRTLAVVLLLLLLFVLLQSLLIQRARQLGLQKTLQQSFVSEQNLLRAQLRDPLLRGDYVQARALLEGYFEQDALIAGVALQAPNGFMLYQAERPQPSTGLRQAQLEIAVAGELLGRLQLRRSDGQVPGWWGRHSLKVTSGLLLLTLVFGFLVWRVVRRYGLDPLSSAVAREQQAYAALFEQSREAIVVLSPQGEVERMNPAAARLLGLAGDQTGLAIRELHSTTVWPQVEALLAAVVRQGQAAQEVCLTTRRRQVEIRASRLKFGDDDHIQLLLQDVTERRQAEAELEALRLELRRNLESYQELFDHSADGLVLRDFNGLLLMANQTYLRMVGYSLEELLGTHCTLLCQRSNCNHFSDLLHNGVTRFECAHRHRDGSWVPVEVRSALVHFQGSQAVLTSVRDIRERREREARLQLLSLVMENSSEGVLVTDSSGSIQAVNQAFSRISGYSEAEVLGQNPRLLQSGSHGPEFYQQLWQQLRQQGSWQGEIWNRAKSGENFPAWLQIRALCDEQGTLRHYVALFADLREAKAWEEKMLKLAQTDPLTGMANRVLLRDRLQQALKRASRKQVGVAVLAVGLDHFKKINDSLGHAVGDQVLVEIGQRLRDCVRAEDTFSRLSGDEFALLVCGLRNDEATQIAIKVLEAVRAPLQLDGMELFLSASIGIACYPDDGADDSALLENADRAMHQAKLQGRDRFCFFSSDFARRASEHFSIERHLRRAIEAGELQLYYQPQVSLADGRLVGAEALLRWQSAELGWVTPDRMIPVAESSGLILPIGQWVLATSCDLIRRHQAATGDWLRIAVNVSVRQFQTAGFVETVRQILQQSEVPPACLELELTESLMMNDVAQAIPLLEELHALGVALALDDFGTGYTSLAYLKRFPVDRVKLDRAFVTDIHRSRSDAALAQSLVAFASAMEFELVAEGIEEAVQHERLRQIGFAYGQGYLFAKPLPEAEFLALVRAGQPLIH
ncbi:EAL domain-containing protein [Desulfuromonas thiophila]|uniref:sensor domain-containing protein n=1 Tax=Desulfuromonas thiophila TaxID=57664 RepID=UPI0029F57A7C|nr:EAL domain-containing protein [Desulfuromonas thiophila]